MTKNITTYSVEWGGEIVAIFKSDSKARSYAQDHLGKGAVVHAWAVPAYVFEFE